MRIRILSDLHNELEVFEIPVMPKDRESTLILAGDIDQISGGRLPGFLELCCAQFKHVLYVLGNHEFYDGDIHRSRAILGVQTKHLPNLHILNDRHIELGGITFIGATLWSDYQGGQIQSMDACRRGMSDHTLIDNGPERLSPQVLLEKNWESVNYIFHVLSTLQGRPTVVITHHLPSYQSIPPRFRSSALNGAFASDLDEQIMTYQPRLWIHGHTHDPVDYKIGDTRVICNPRGYAGYEYNPRFNSYLAVNI